MRKQFVRTVEDLMAREESIVLMLGDIGVFGFRNSFARYPQRTLNIGICEQAMVGVAAGLAREGFVPVLHSIAPFVVERCFEQIKVDFCYQRMPAKIVSVGGSYDYAGLGATHHCPGDVAILQTLPGMEIVVPGTASEFDALFQATYADGHPTYYRLSERSNSESLDVIPGRAQVIQEGSGATLLAVGPMLEPVREAIQGWDVTLLYYTTIAPFDLDTLVSHSPSSRVAVIEPFLEGTTAQQFAASSPRSARQVLSIGIPRCFCPNTVGLKTMIGHSA